MSCILLFTARVHRIDAGESHSNMTRYTLRSLDNTYTMEAVSHQNGLTIQAGKFIDEDFYGIKFIDIFLSIR